jgi:uroporphyrinogen III methyltransferase/synthase
MRAPTGFCVWREGQLETDRKKPLGGRRIVVTRAPEQAQDLVERLEQLGAEVLLLPTVSFCEPKDTASLDAALRSLDSFDWLLFTSANAARFFAQRCQALGLGPPAVQSSRVPGPPRPMIAAVGPATAQAASDAGFRVDRVAVRSTSQGLAEELRGTVTGRRILLPRSDRAGVDLPRALRQAGADVVEAIAYCTRAPEGIDGVALERICQCDVDVVAFASPSAFRHFQEAIGAETIDKLRTRTVLAAIGPTTAGAIREAGLTVEIEAEESTSAGLARAIASHFERSPSGVKGP